MEDEFTTDMHYDMLQDEFSELEFAIMDIYGAIQRGIPKNEALKEHNMPEEVYDKNVKLVLGI